MLDVLIFLLAVAMAFAVAFAAGSNDEMMAPGVAAGAFSLRTAVILGAIFSVLGVFLGEAVVKTLGEDLVKDNILTDAMVITVLLVMVIILVGHVTIIPLPISTTQTVVGAIVGVAIVAGFTYPEWGINAVDYWVLLLIFLGWILSPIIGFIVAATVHLWIQRLDESVEGFTSRQKKDQAYIYALGLFLIISSASRAGNDVANSIAPVLGLNVFQSEAITTNMWVMMLIGGVGMALGLVIIGKIVIRVVAKELVEMNPSSGLSSMISVTFIITLGTLLGFPLSGTHVLIAAMIAVGWAERSPIQRQMVKTIVISWIVTVPIAAILGGVIWFGVDWIFTIVGI
ncbi:MAG: inorganic phosphate transporter [Candidatus Heimdallarchaeota archaeon]|nr:MAG: inorganic phosphate transporter [Candidatus Heimdallarchaeota archaeon]